MLILTLLNIRYEEGKWRRQTWIAGPANPQGPPDAEGLLTSVFPGDVLQNQVAVFWHVLLKPSPTMDLLVGWRNHEETESETKSNQTQAAEK